MNSIINPILVRLYRITQFTVGDRNLLRLWCQAHRLPSCRPTVVFSRFLANSRLEGKQWPPRPSPLPDWISFVGGHDGGRGEVGISQSPANLSSSQPDLCYYYTLTHTQTRTRANKDVVNISSSAFRRINILCISSSYITTTGLTVHCTVIECDDKSRYVIAFAPGGFEGLGIKFSAEL
jgi:hypothetical protein